MGALLLNNTKTNKMKPIEEASELIVNFQLECKSLEYEEAKQCAVIAVNKILDAIKNFPYGIEYLCIRDHYQEVKEEIEKM